jgi:WD40 repeat protein
MLNKLSQRFGRTTWSLLGLAGILALLLVTGFLWWWLPVLPRTTCTGELDWTFDSPFSAWAYRELVISPNGQTLAAEADFGNTIHCWDTATGRRLPSVPRCFPDHITQDWFLPDGRTLISAKYATTLGPQDPGASFPAEEAVKFGNWRRVLTVSSDGQLLVALHDWVDPDRVGHHVFKIWDLASGQEREGGPWDPTRLGTIVKRADGRILAFAYGDDDSATVWDLVKRTKCATFSSESTPKLVNGDFLQTTSTEGVQLCDLATGKQRVQFPNRADLRIEHWDKATGQLYETEGDADPLGFTPKGIVAWDIKTSPPRQRGSIPGNGNRTFSADGRWMASAVGRLGSAPALGISTLNFAGVDGQIELWDLSTLEQKHTISAFLRGEYPDDRHWGGPYGGRIPIARFAPDSSVVAAMIEQPPGRIVEWLGLGSIPAVRIWDPATGQLLATLWDCEGFTYFPDGKSMATWSRDGIIRIWDLPPHRPWWIEFGLPVLFAMLVLLGCWQCTRFRKRMVGPAVPGGTAGPTV